MRLQLLSPMRCFLPLLIILFSQFPRHHCDDSWETGVQRIDGTNIFSSDSCFICDVAAAGIQYEFNKPGVVEEFLECMTASSQEPDGLPNQVYRVDLLPKSFVRQYKKALFSGSARVCIDQGQANRQTHAIEAPNPVSVQLLPSKRPRLYPSRGTNTLLLVHVTSTAGEEPELSTSFLEDILVGTDQNILSQFTDCAQGQLTLIPFTDNKVVNGVLNVQYPGRISGSNITGSIQSALNGLVIQSLGVTDLAQTADHILYILPTGGLVSGNSDWTALTLRSDRFSYFQHGWVQVGNIDYSAVESYQASLHLKDGEVISQCSTLDPIDPSTATDDAPTLSPAESRTLSVPTSSVATLVQSVPLAPSSLSRSLQTPVRPTRRPTRRPSRKPTRRPTSRPTKRRRPTRKPTRRPTSKPSPKPRRKPITTSPSSSPVAPPTDQPITLPPTPFPTLSPSQAPITTEPRSPPSTTTPSTSPFTTTPSKAPFTTPPSKAPFTPAPSHQAFTTAPSIRVFTDAPSNPLTTFAPTETPAPSIPFTTLPPTTIKPTPRPPVPRPTKKPRRRGPTQLSGTQAPSLNPTIFPTTPAPSQSGPTPAFSEAALKLPGKKGVAFVLLATTEQLAFFKILLLGAYWNYSWGLPRSANQPSNSEFVPMVWGGTTPTRMQDRLNTVVAPLVNTGQVKRLLAFNEPDHKDQANISPDTAISLWPYLETLGIPLCSPSCAATLSSTNNDWLEVFMAKIAVNNYRVDYLGVHWYAEPSAKGFQNYMQKVYALYKRPLLITEFAVADWSATATKPNRYTRTQVLAFMKIVLPWMETQSWIAGYSWFSFNPASVVGGISALFDTAGNLTACGRYYQSVTNENPLGDQTIKV